MANNINSNDFNFHDLNEIQTQDYSSEENNTPLFAEILEELGQLNSQIAEMVNEVGAQRNALDKRAEQIQNNNEAIKRQSDTIRNLVK